MILPPYLKLMRPKQWTKNSFVLLPLVTSLQLTDPTAILAALVATVIFSMLASSIYIVNDWCDIEADRAHSEKKTRPLAAGTVTKKEAAVLVVGLILGAVVLTVMVEATLRLIVVLVLYVVQSVSYSFGLKHVPLFEMFLVASGYVLRVIAGCFVLDIDPSRWILLATGLVALLITVSKRRAELTAAIGAEKFRKALCSYTVTFLDQLMAACAAMVIMAYVLFTISDYAIERFGEYYLFETSVLVVFGVFRYMQIVAKPGAGGDPTAVVARDRPLQICVLIWALALLAILYLA